MAERIYIKNSQGGLEPLEEEPFSTEDDLQALLAEHPELLDGEQMRPGNPRRWILVTREKGIAETPEAGERYALDHLLIDQDATPTLVEVKRGSNPEIRRKVVGQMLDYAAHAALTWTAQELRLTFEASTSNHHDVLRDLLQTDDEPDADTFWNDVATNLAATRLRLLFVADEIPDSLARIVSFLNEQTRDNIEVLAVEIKQFSGETTQTLVPRVIGRTAAPPGKDKLTYATLLADFTNDKARAAVERLLNVTKSGGSLGWNPSSVSLQGSCRRLHPRPVPVVRIYPPSMGAKSFYFGWIGPSWGYPTKLQQRLREWTSQFEGDSFTEVSGTLGYWWTMTPDDVAEHIDVLESRLKKILSDLDSLEAGEGA